MDFDKLVIRNNSVFEDASNFYSVIGFTLDQDNVSVIFRVKSKDTQRISTTTYVRRLRDPLPEADPPPDPSPDSRIRLSRRRRELDNRT